MSVQRKSCFWLWLWMTANPFGWTVSFSQKQKQLKAQPKEPYTLSCVTHLTNDLLVVALIISNI
jgi:hypothetical protein